MSTTEVPLMKDGGIVVLPRAIYEKRYDHDTDKTCACWCVHCQQWVAWQYPRDAYKADRCPKCNYWALYSDPFIEADKEPPQSPATRPVEDQNMEMSEKTAEEWVSTTEAARRYHLTQPTVHKHAIDGDFSYRDGLVEVKSFMAWLAASKDKIAFHQEAAQKGWQVRRERHKERKGMTRVLDKSQMVPIEKAAKDLKYDRGWVAYWATRAKRIPHVRSGLNVLVNPDDVKNFRKVFDEFSAKHILVSVVADGMKVDDKTVCRAMQRGRIRVHRLYARGHKHVALEDVIKIEEMLNKGAPARPRQARKSKPVARQAVKAPLRKPSVPAKGSAPTKGLGVAFMLPPDMQAVLSPLFGDRLLGTQDALVLAQLANMAAPPYKEKFTLLADVLRTFKTEED